MLFILFFFFYIFGFKLYFSTHNNRLPLEVDVVDTHHLVGRKSNHRITTSKCNANLSYTLHYVNTCSYLLSRKVFHISFVREILSYEHELALLILS